MHTSEHTQTDTTSYKHMYEYTRLVRTLKSTCKVGFLWCRQTMKTYNNKRMWKDKKYELCECLCEFRCVNVLANFSVRTNVCQKCIKKD